MKSLQTLCAEASAFLEKMPAYKFNPKWINVQLLPTACNAFLLAQERNLDSESVFYASIFRSIRKLNISEENIPCVTYLQKYNVLENLGIDNKEKIYDIIMSVTSDCKDPNAKCVVDANLEFEYNFLSHKINNKGNDLSSKISDMLLDRFSNMKNLLSYASEEYQDYFNHKIYLLDKMINQKAHASEEEKKILRTFLITLKCGHVGHGKYYPLRLVKHSTSKKDAVLSALTTARVKRNDPNVVLDVKEVSFAFGKRIARKNNHDPYLKIKGKKSRLAIMPCIQRKVCEDLDYKPQKVKSNPKTIKEKVTYTPVYGIRNKKKYSKFHYEPTLELTEEDINEAIKQGLS